MSGIRFVNPDPQFFDDNGVVLSGGSLTFYTTGTSTFATTYNTDALAPGDENTNPIDLDADGRASVEIFLDPTVAYRAVLKDALGAVIWDRDPITGSDIAAAIAAHNADPLAHLDASESQRGMIEIANDAEAIAKTDPDKALCPKNLAALGASKTFAGLVEQATDAETEAGTDDERYLSPKNAQALQATAAEIVTGTDALHFIGIAQWVANWTVAGSPPELSGKFPGGYTIKVGKRTSTIDSAEVFTFAAPFASAIYGLFLQIIENGSERFLAPSSSAPPTITGFTIDRNDGIDTSPDFYFLAVGL